MTELTLKLTGMAHGGLAFGRDSNGRVIFVPFALPGETVRVRLPDGTQRGARAELLEVIKPVGDRSQPRCPHFGICGNCHFQHMTYAAQLRAKEAAVRDQLTRVGGLKNPAIRPIGPYPNEFAYRAEIALFPVVGGGLGFWSPIQKQIFSVEQCPVLEPRLQEALADLDIDLPDLRKLVLRLGDEDDLLAALETEDVEPPELVADFPISVAIVFPDRVAAALIGDPYLTVTIKDRPFRFSPGGEFPTSPAAAAMVIDAVSDLAGITSDSKVLEIPGGPGWLTATLAEQAAAVLAIENNPDSVADAVVNLDEFENVMIYEGFEEEILPGLEYEPDVVILRQDQTINATVWNWLKAQRPPRVLIIAEAGIVGKIAPQMTKTGYRLHTTQPLDTQPQSFQVDVVSVWLSGRGST